MNKISVVVRKFKNSVDFFYSSILQVLIHLKGSYIISKLEDLKVNH